MRPEPKSMLRVMNEVLPCAELCTKLRNHPKPFSPPNSCGTMCKVKCVRLDKKQKIGALRARVGHMVLQKLPCSCCARDRSLPVSSVDILVADHNGSNFEHLH
ncbi:hypothetical protein CLAIMM_06896 isoform 1, partial [Cladophialophora immunda]